MNGTEAVLQRVVVALAVHLQQYAADHVGIDLFHKLNRFAGKYKLLFHSYAPFYFIGDLIRSLLRLYLLL